MTVDLQTNETIGSRIRRFRNERNMSQSQLAECVGVTFGWISQIEQDKATASPDLLNKISSAFKIPIRELLQDEDQHMELISRIKLVEVLLETNQHQEAERIILELDTHSDISKKDRIALSVHLSECRYRQQRYDEALLILHPVIESLESENYHDGQLLAWIRNKIGKSYFKKSEYTNAFYNYQKAYDLINRFQEFDQLAARISYNVGMALRRKGFDKAAIPYLDRSREFFENRQSLWDLAHSIFEQGKALKNVKNFAKAAECFDKSKVLFETLNFQKWSTEVQITYASSIVAQENPKEAIAQLYNTLDSLEKESDFAGVAFVLSIIADIHLSLGQLKSSHSVLEKAESLVFAHSLQNTLEAGECFATYAKYFLQSENYKNSIEYALNAVKIFGTINMLRDQASSLKYVVEAYEQMGELTNALKFEKQRSRLLEELSKEGT